jgi:hypothetical protein
MGFCAHHWGWPHMNSSLPIIIHIAAATDVSNNNESHEVLNECQNGNSQRKSELGNVIHRQWSLVIPKVDIVTLPDFQGRKNDHGWSENESTKKCKQFIPRTPACGIADTLNRHNAE